MELKAKIESDYIKELKDEEVFIIVAKQLGYECLKPVKSIDIDERWDVLLKKLPIGLSGQRKKITVRNMRI